jgi:A/G-specific adenine glycosylase
MLQQTQVGTVIPYFERFIARFPDVTNLAAGSLDDVLALWSGLGYYARARNLHRAAKIVDDELGGTMPDNLDDMLRLPGIGRSTGAAILALAGNQRHAILDGNCKRVLARFHAVRGSSGHAGVARELWALAEAHTPETRVADYTQAIMDLGATVCTRGQPRCSECPVSNNCEARQLGIERELPHPRKKPNRGAREVTVLVVQNESSETLLERRPPAGIWGGLLSFPELAEGQEIGDWCRRYLGVLPESQQTLDPVEHAFTHFDLTLRPVRLTVEAGGAGVMDGERWLWYNSTQPLPGGVAAPIGKILREVAQSESIPNPESMH